MERQWEKELTEYIIQGEPNQKERSLIWKTAIGLQDVDKLSTSEYLLLMKIYLRIIFLSIL